MKNGNTLVSILLVIVVILVIAVVALASFTLGRIQSPAANAGIVAQNPAANAITQNANPKGFTDPAQSEIEYPENATVEDKNANNNSSAGTEGAFGGGAAFVIPENSEENAVIQTFGLLYGSLDNIKTDRIQQIAPGQYWSTVLRNNPDFSIDDLRDDLADMMKSRQSEWDKMFPSSSKMHNFILGYGKRNIVKTYEWYDLADIQRDLNEKYGIPESAVTGAADVSVSITAFAGGGKDRLNIEPTITVVLIDNRWYVYDSGMFYPDLLIAITQSSSGYNYLMDAKWLK